MVALTEDGLDLFHAEIIALSLIANTAVDGNLSSLAQDRHKVRKTDIERFLAEAAAAPAWSFARLTGTIQLMNVCAGAYCEVQAICAAKYPEEVEVIPYYSRKRQELRLACLREPLNLYYGPALGNLRGNTETFDPHYVTALASASGEFQQNAFGQSQVSATTTEGMDKIRLASRAGSGRLEPSGGDLGPWVRDDGRRPSIFSQTLSDLRPFDHGNLLRLNYTDASLFGRRLFLSPWLHDILFDPDKVGGFNEAASVQLIWEIEQLRERRTVFERLTQAGLDHFRALVEQVGLRQTIIQWDALQTALNRLVGAYHAWRDNRAFILNRIDAILARMEAQRGWIVVSNDGNWDPYSYLFGLENAYWWN